MKCEFCGTEFEGIKRCPNCGKHITESQAENDKKVVKPNLNNIVYCRKCGSPISEEDEFCRKCGAGQNSSLSSGADENKPNNSSDNVNLLALFSFLCGVVLLFIPMIQKTLILLVGVIGIALAFSAMIKKKPAASAFQNVILPIISLLMCLGAIIITEIQWSKLTSLF